MVGGVRGREKYVLSFPGTFSAHWYEVQIWLVCSKLSAWHPAYQFVYFSFMMAFYNTHLALGFILHKRGPHECKNTKKTACCWILKHWLETAAMAVFPVVEITDCVHSWDDSFQRVPRGIIQNALSVMTVYQCGHKLHRTVSLSWINVLSCIPCTSPAAVERSYYIPWHGKLATVSRHIILPFSLLQK